MSMFFYSYSCIGSGENAYRPTLFTMLRQFVRVELQSRSVTTTLSTYARRAIYRGHVDEAQPTSSLFFWRVSVAIGLGLQMQQYLPIREMDSPWNLYTVQRGSFATSLAQMSLQNYLGYGTRFRAGKIGRMATHRYECGTAPSSEMCGRKAVPLFPFSFCSAAFSFFLSTPFPISPRRAK
ncbi:uncharacterized protein EI97DRAFT_38180 [Westerdykella ornata]|uniref:Uncharacterized protein n=1 Tax=Westerdykella ornata TaxID=318751 RepID=A0A6A6JIW8_WESOR|nr:uncharacterized protein EI97DRAFT_38180 [Westerdykella ornata]KAF2276397.1 hypothetical protein EI97DRAFT_38180 [Westerdykella ornata]